MSFVKEVSMNWNGVISMIQDELTTQNKHASKRSDLLSVEAANDDDDLNDSKAMNWKGIVSMIWDELITHNRQHSKHMTWETTDLPAVEK